MDTEDDHVRISRFTDAMKLAAAAAIARLVKEPALPIRQEVQDAAR